MSKRNPTRAQIKRDYEKEMAKRKQMGLEPLSVTDFIWRWYPEWFGRKNPSGKKKNPKTVRLKNFTGTVRLNPNKTVSVVGRQKKARRKAK